MRFCCLFIGQTNSSTNSDSLPFAENFRTNSSDLWIHINPNNSNRIRHHNIIIPIPHRNTILLEKSTKLNLSLDHVQTWWHEGNIIILPANKHQQHSIHIVFWCNLKSMYGIWDRSRWWLRYTLYPYLITLCMRKTWWWIHAHTRP